MRSQLQTATIKMGKMKKVIFFVTIIFLYGCSVRVKIYFRNMTDRDVEICCYTMNNLQPNISYINSIADIKFDTDKTMLNNLKCDKNADCYKFVIPKFSTIFLENGLNYHFSKFDKIIIEKRDTLSWEDGDKFAKMSQGFPVKRWMWYEIK